MFALTSLSWKFIKMRRRGGSARLLRALYIAGSIFTAASTTTTAIGGQKIQDRVFLEFFLRVLILRAASVAQEDLFNYTTFGGLFTRIILNIFCLLRVLFACNKEKVSS